jgi:acyl carrier protein
METVEEFIKKLEPEFEDLEPGTLKSDTIFRNLPNWSSMHALIIIALADTEYELRITGEDIRKCNTIADIHQVLKLKEA